MPRPSCHPSPPSLLSSPACSFDSHLNIEQLGKVLVDLMDYYSAAWAQGLPSPGAPECVALQLIISAGEHGKYGRQRMAAATILAQLPPEVLAAPQVQLALQVSRAAAAVAAVAHMAAAITAASIAASWLAVLAPRHAGSWFQAAGFAVGCAAHPTAPTPPHARPLTP
jgi:hypothetical protein